MQTFILGLDGLDATLVERLQLSNILQEHHGRLTVPISKMYGVPMTPEVWAAFLCGRFVEGLDFEHQNEVEKFLMRNLRWIRSHMPSFVRKNLRMGLGARIIKPKVLPKLNEPTFLDVTDTLPINVPYYNYENKVGILVSKFVQKEITLNECIKYMKQAIMETMREIEDATSAPNEIIFAYSQFPDVFCHLFFAYPRYINQHYVDLDLFVGRLQEQLDDTLLLIVSDHGFDVEKETHSSYGFYSSNQLLTPVPENIIDLYRIITERADISNSQ